MRKWGLHHPFPRLQAQVKQVFNHSIWEKNWLLGSKLADTTEQKLTQVVGQLSTVLAKKDFMYYTVSNFLRRKSENSLALILK